MKFVKILSHKNFPLYGNRTMFLIHVIVKYTCVIVVSYCLYHRHKNVHVLNNPYLQYTLTKRNGFPDCLSYVEERTKCLQKLQQHDSISKDLWGELRQNLGGFREGLSG